MKEIFPKESLFLKEDKRFKRWAVPYNYEALNARSETLISRNSKYIKDAKVLDLGCHFGSMTYASLFCGAKYVCGIDSESKLIEQGKSLFDRHDVSFDKYDLIATDVIGFLEEAEENSFDTVLCFGLLYYLSDPFYALKLMKKVAKKAIILDTFTAYYLGTVSKDSHEVNKYADDDTFKLPFMFYSVTQSKKLDYDLKDNRKAKNLRPLSMLTLPTEKALENFFLMLGLAYKKISWSKFENNNYTWRDFFKQEVKEQSHWSDIYHSNIRVSYLLTK